ncbi:hypothetical protein SAMN02910292_02981 [Lachnospiraceae bacterium XBB2008]|nr:hypothetical protein SAMN02910292_02981 [Lachnospiraceae bacterium XBB2008]
MEGACRKDSDNGDKTRCHKYRILGFVVPFLLHGFYDFCCFSNNWLVEHVVFYVFYIILALATFINFRHYTKADTPLEAPGVPETLVA